MSTHIPFCTEITHLGGVTLPRNVRCFDVRIPDEHIFDRFDPHGSHLWSSERASYALGLRPARGVQYDTTPVSMQTYEDLRRASEARLAEIAVGMADMLKRYLREYNRAKRNPAKPGEGGGVYYKPVGMALCNYGYSVICDEREKIVYSLAA